VQRKDMRRDEGHNGEVATFESFQPACVSAYMWYLLAEKAAVPMLDQIEQGKKNIHQTMSPQQLAEAEARAAAWLRNTKKHSGFAGISESEEQRKMRAGA
jgi:hypothetical protein